MMAYATADAFRDRGTFERTARLIAELEAALARVTEQRSRWAKHYSLGVAQAEQAREAVERKLAEMTAERNRDMLILKMACDRSWTDETPHQIVNITANALYWARKAKEAAERRAAQLAEALQAIERAMRARADAICSIGERDAWGNEVRAWADKIAEALATLRPSEGE